MMEYQVEAEEKEGVLARKDLIGFIVL